MVEWLTLILASLAGLAALFYALSKMFVSEKTCTARQDCIEGQINTLHLLVKKEFKHIKELLEKLTGNE